MQTMRTKIFHIIFIVLCSITLIACSNTDNENVESEQNTTGNETTDIVNDTQAKNDLTNNNGNNVSDEQNEMINQLNSSYFKEVSIDIEYPNRNEFEAEIDYDHGKITAKVEDTNSSKMMRGKEAFDYIFSRIGDLELSIDTPEEDVFSQIVDRFELPNDYVEINVEILFQDGTEIEFERGH